MAHPRRIHRLTDPLDLPRLSPAALHSATADGVLLEAGEAPRAFVRPAPEFHDDPDGARLFAGFADQAILYPPAFLTSSRQAELVGYRTILTQDGACFTDESLPPDARAAFIDRLGARDAFHNEDTGLRPSGQPGDFTLAAEGRARAHLAGSTVVLCSNEPSNFGSFLFRVLPKLHAVQRYGLGQLNLLVYARAPQKLHYLSLLGVQLAQVRLHDTHTIYALDHAIHPCMRNNQAFLDDETRDLFAKLRQRYGSGGARRIYVSRLSHSGRAASSRVMLNEAALIARLRALDFQIVEPEILSAREQIEVFAAAEMVVGPSGAGMFNVAFCRPGTRVIDIESEPHWIHGHSCLFASCGLRYAIFEAKVDATDPAKVHRRFTVNIDALCERIAQFGAERVAPPPPPDTRAGTLDRVTPDFAAGWARLSGGASAEVEIAVNGVVVGRVRADLPREDLHHLGACAFRFHFAAPIAPGSSVSARFSDTLAELTHSPRQ